MDLVPNKEFNRHDATTPRENIGLVEPGEYLDSLAEKVLDAVKESSALSLPSTKLPKPWSRGVVAVGHF